MPAWSWWVIFGGIVLLSIVMFALIGRNLWRRSKRLAADLQELAAVAESFSAALGAMTPPPATVVGGPPGPHRALP